VYDDDVVDDIATLVTRVHDSKHNYIHLV